MGPALGFAGCRVMRLSPAAWRAGWALECSPSVSPRAGAQGGLHQRKPRRDGWACLGGRCKAEVRKAGVFVLMGVLAALSTWSGAVLVAIVFSGYYAKMLLKLNSIRDAFTFSFTCPRALASGTLGTLLRFPVCCIFIVFG